MPSAGELLIICVCRYSYLRPPPAPGAGCRGSADRAGRQRKPWALRQQRSPPRPSPQSRCCDLQRKWHFELSVVTVCSLFTSSCSSSVFFAAASATARPSFHPLHHKQENGSTRAERLENTIKLTELWTLSAGSYVLITLQFNTSSMCTNTLLTFFCLSCFFLWYYSFKLFQTERHNYLEETFLKMIQKMQIQTWSLYKNILSSCDQSTESPLGCTQVSDTSISEQISYCLTTT